MKISEFISRHNVRLPPLTITSVYRANSNHHSQNMAFDFVPNWENFPLIAGQKIESWKLDLYLAKYLNDNYPGGLGINFSGRCRHFHLDSGNKRRWEEKTFKTGSCSESHQNITLRHLDNIPILIYPFFTAYLNSPFSNIDYSRSTKGDPFLVSLKSKENLSLGGGSILLLAIVILLFSIKKWTK